MAKIDSWITKIPRLKNSKVARFSYRAEAYANDEIEGVSSYDYARDMNVPLATHTEFDASMLSIGARANLSSVPKNGLNHFFGRVSYNLNKTIDFLADLLDDFISFTEIVKFTTSSTLAPYPDGTTKRLLNTAASSITITLPAGETYLGSSTIALAPSAILTITKIGTVWLNFVDNAGTATKLATARTINGVSFDGSADITVADATKAPIAHASPATTYGVSSEANYGHAKASTVAGSANGTASKGTTPTVFAQSDHVHPIDTTREPAFTKNTAFNKNFETTASNIKANGTQSVGSSSNVPRADHVHPLQTSVSGNAGTATKLATPRKIGSVDFDGSANISLWTKVAEISTPSTTLNINLAAYEYVNIVLKNTDGYICSSTLTKISDAIDKYVLNTCYFTVSEQVFSGNSATSINTAKVITQVSLFDWSSYAFGKIIIYAM